MANSLDQTAEEILGEEFWTQPDGVLSTEFNLIYAQVLSVLREEVRSRGGSSIDFLIVERMAFSYAYLRFRETQSADAENGNAITDRTRREMNKDWLDLATSMKKMWNSEDKENLGEAILKKVNKAIFEAVKELPEAQAREIQGRLAESFGSVGL